jgi:phosphoglycolate phosphatase
VKALLFDLDGTLTDPREGITRCIAHALEKMGRQAPPLDDLLFAIGPPLRGSFAKLLATEDGGAVEAAIAAYRERFSTIGLFENALYPGTRDTLVEARARGHAIFLATSKPIVFATRILDHFDLMTLFDGAYGSELDGRRDDKTELLAHLLAERKLEAAHCVMIGDRSHDMVAARNHGMTGLGVTWGYGSRDELTRAGAHALCDSPSHILDFARELPLVPR